MNESESRAALSSLTGPLPATDAEALHAQHAALKPRLRELVRGLPARRRRQRLVRGALAASSLALCAGLAVFAWQFRGQRPAPFTVESGSSTPLANAGQGFVTGPAEATALRTRGGALVSVGSASRVEAITVEAIEERIVLDRGSVHVRVPHLAPGGSFAVKTPDALVTVHGTVFHVNVANSAQGTRTCVSVDEGVVSVERLGARVVLQKGESDNCAPVAPARAAPSDGNALPAQVPPSVAAAPAASVSAAAVQKPGSVPGGLTKPSGSGATGDATLAEQNRLLAAGLQAEQAGRFAEAQRHLQLLIERYPASALRAEAERSLARARRKAP
jgi:hypothetical protein